MIAGPRKQARQQNKTTYFTGKPCIRGHVSKRYVSTGGCDACLRENEIYMGSFRGEASKKRLLGFSQLTLYVKKENVTTIKNFVANLESATNFWKEMQ